MNLNLVRLLEYKNSKVITHFCYHHPQWTASQAEQLFNDLLAWMWLNKQRVQEKKKTYLFGPLLILDEIWHTFILHTRDYVDFCQNYFNDYFHHDVEPIGAEHMLEEEEITDFLQDCFKYLSQEWVERRFDACI